MLNSSHNKLWIFAIAVILSSCEDIQNHNSAPKVSADNEMFKLSIQADTDVATITNTIHFEVRVKRRKDFVIRKDSKIIGTFVMISEAVLNSSETSHIISSFFNAKGIRLRIATIAIFNDPNITLLPEF